MRKSILITILVLLVMAAAAYAAECLSFAPFEESFGYSSDEMFGGGSYLGVDTRDVTSDRLGALNLKEEHGVEVTMVDQDAPAGKAGIKEHDVILTLNGTAVESVEQLRRMIREVPPGRTVTLGLSRNGQPVTVKAQLADRKKAFVFAPNPPNAENFKFVMPNIPELPDIDVPMSVVVVHSSMRSGLMVENLTPQLGDFFGSKDGRGVLVRSVEKGSRAEKAGFRAGDVIVKVNGEPINDSGDFSHELRGRKENTVNVGIIRDKKEQTLTLTLPERRQSGSLEENSEAPEIDAETRIEMREAQTEMARVKPQLAIVNRELERAKPEMERAAREMERMKPEMERMARELCRERVQMQDDSQEIQNELREQQQELQERLGRAVQGGADI
ncbi:MAG: PDZ domain-containing protein [Acidobacteriia bacterium]|nr:PDZ domain-containing protein [Terriglobia bacterium]